MTAIISNWKEYFKDHNEGLGTTYERFILHQCFQDIKKEHSIESVLEVPSFGMTGISGINSMWWAYTGIPVTVLDNHLKRLELISKVWADTGFKSNLVFHDQFENLPFKDRSFDLSWSFTSLWFISNLDEFFKELIRVTKKVIFICVPNKKGVGYRFQASLGKNKKTNLRVENIHPVRIRKSMEKRNWILQEEGFLDVPPWPDIAMKKGDFLRLFGLKKVVDIFEKPNSDGLCILNYFKGRHKNMERKVLKYGFLENMPTFLKGLWAHHRYFIFTHPSEPILDSL